MTGRALAKGLVALAAVVLGLGCRGGSAPAGAPAADKNAVISKTSQSGPVSATVSLAPAQPRLGDPIELTLTVTAAPGVELRMPAFGEALGRFAITGFVPRKTTRADGTTEASQQYTLDAPMSGRQKIPALLVEFVDRRARQDAGVVLLEASELLTEELSLEVASVLEGGEQGALRPARGPLAEAGGRPWWRRWLPWGGGCILVLGLAAWLLLRAWRRRRRARARVSAFDLAMKRLAALERRGLPSAAEADAWYVDASAIVRRYLEDRYGLRAPELTTEEFLRIAGESEHLQPAHRGLLRSFLERCDRVKFAAYRPPASESHEVLAAARRFLEETRLGAPTAGGGDALHA